MEEKKKPSLIEEEKSAVQRYDILSKEKTDTIRRANKKSHIQ